MRARSDTRSDSLCTSSRRTARRGAAIAWCALFALLVLPAPACRTTHRPANHDAANAQPVHAGPSRAWRVVESGRLVGFVVSFREDDAAAEAREFYSVRNEFHQELGMIDALGRAWRYRPFQGEPEHVATSTVVEGARAILGASEAALLVEVSLAELRIPR